MITKTQVKKGQRVLVKTPHPLFTVPTKVYEAEVVDAQGSCLKIRRKWWIFSWAYWVDSTDKNRAIEIPKNP